MTLLRIDPAPRPRPRVELFVAFGLGVATGAVLLARLWCA